MNSPAWAGEARGRNAFYRVGEDASEGSDSIETVNTLGGKKTKTSLLESCLHLNVVYQINCIKCFFVYLFACLR